MNASVLFDPADPALHVDPYSVYRRLQSEAPVYWCDLGFWVASRYNDIAELFRDRSFGQGEFIDNIRIFYGDDFDVMAQPAYRWLSKIFVMQDPPDHTRMRGLITKALSAKRVAAMEPRIAEICARLLGDLAGRDEVDFVHEFAYKLPTLVMCDMLGLTAEEYSDEMLTELNQAIADSFLVFETRALEPDELDRANRQIELLNEYFGELFERRRKQPREDLATALVSSREGRDQLTHEELVTSTIGMFGAGFETTAHMIGNGLLALHQHPDQWRALVQEPSLAASATEEILRYDSSLQATYRTALRDNRVGGQPVDAGQRVLLLLAAANRDPDVFMEPERFDIRRSDVKTLGFGGGIHFCIGAALARLEGKVTFEQLATKMPAMEADTENPRWREGFLFRGLSELPVRTVA
ncbi:MAG TPA: cytochrome P450 [Woeseiaceae bacterium]|nr:cytochrome P450 [Woeseiaceae bacterium]